MAAVRTKTSNESKKIETSCFVPIPVRLGYFTTARKKKGRHQPTVLYNITGRGINVGGVGGGVVHPQTYVSVGCQMSAVGLKM